MTIKELAAKLNVTTPAIYQRIQRAKKYPEFQEIQLYTDDTQKELTEEAVTYLTRNDRPLTNDEISNNALLKSDNEELRAERDELKEGIKSLNDLLIKETEKNTKLISEENKCVAVISELMNRISDKDAQIKNLEAQVQSLYGLLAQEQQNSRLLLEAPKKGILTWIKEAFTGSEKK